MAERESERQAGQGRERGRERARECTVTQCSLVLRARRTDSGDRVSGRSRGEGQSMMIGCRTEILLLKSDILNFADNTTITCTIIRTHRHLG